MEDSAARYQFLPLPGRDYIRVLQLRRRLDDESPLTSSLMFLELTSREPQYTSVSYSWGRNSDGGDALTHEIVIDERTLRITENFYDGLMQLSKPNSTHEQLLWKDAICINQDDKEERNSQVLLMYVIYSRASSLIIWLGHGADENEDHDAANAVLSFEYEVLPVGTTPEHDPPDEADELPNDCPSWVWPRLVRYALAGLSGLEVCRCLLDGAQSKELLTRPKVNARLLQILPHKRVHDFAGWAAWMYKAAQKLCARRYFQRRWVIQELYHSNPDTIVMCWGAYNIRAADFDARWHLMQSLLHAAYDRLFYKDSWLKVSSQIGDDYGTSCTLLALSIREIDFSHHDMPRIIDFLYAYGYTTCTDSRDLVYAFLSFSDIKLSVDYSQSAEEVFFALASRVVKSGGLEYVLAAASHQYTRGYRLKHGAEPTSLPSWVPDLRCHLGSIFQTF